MENNKADQPKADQTGPEVAQSLQEKSDKPQENKDGAAVGKAKQPQEQ